MSRTALPASLASSRYAAQLLAARPELADELTAERAFDRAALCDALAGAAMDNATALKRRLRRLRDRVLLRTMLRDLTGTGDLAEVCATMSDLAEVTITTALEWASTGFAAEHGTPRGSGGDAQHLIVVGMGKLGGRELNVSSDIDLVFLYPEEGNTDGHRPLSNHEYFTRLGRKLVELLAEVTEDGFVFRVDLRLRPYGDSGQLVSSFEAFENYLVAQGREWERYAWIKARALTGARHDELAAIVRPFVYRKYLDYASLAAMRRLHAEVRHEVARRELAEHVKLGPGGIREIEFVAQAIQLVRGGRDPALQTRPTLAVLARLAERRLLPELAARELAEAYIFLRRLEHRLQYLDDRQTHMLPSDEDDRAHVAQMMGFESWEVFATQLAKVRAAVTRHFQAVLAEATDTTDNEVWGDNVDVAAHWLASHSYRHPKSSARRLAVTRSSQRYAMLPADSRRRMDALVPALALTAADTPDPDVTLARGIDLIEAVARRAAYLALLAENPGALRRVAKILSASSWAAEFMTRQPLLLDEVLDDRVLYAPANWEDYEARLRTQLAAQTSDLEQQMNTLREQHQVQVFRLLAKDLAGLLPLERLADHLSEIADRTLAASLDLAWAQVRTRHRDRPRFSIIGYGKLGGKELGYASDLDIVFLYDDPDPEAPVNYALLAQRLNNVLTTRTSSGVLFETDLRLRPSGASGLLVSSLAAFEQYQEKTAWVWEHQALTRARYCAGDRKIGQAFGVIRERVLRRERDPATLASEVLKMRKKMHDGHPNQSRLFDLKHDSGGMIDIEFVVQFLVLAYAYRHERLTRNLGNIALLGIAGDLGLIPAALAERCRVAYRELRRLQHALRLNGAQYARVPLEDVAAHVSTVRELWKTVFGPFN